MSSPSKPNIIDVEQYAKRQELKYAYDPDSVVPINAEEFRQGVRQRKEKGKNEDRVGQIATSPIVTVPQARMGSAGTPIQRHPERTNYPSAIAPAIHELRMKRSLTRTPPISTSATLLKNRRFEHHAPSSSTTTPKIMAHPSGHATSQTPIPGSSKDNVVSRRQRTSVVASSCPQKRPIVIELASDGEEVLITHPTKKLKIQKRTTPIIEISDSDSEPITSHLPDALPVPEPESTDESEVDDLNDSDRWKLIRMNKNKLEIQETTAEVDIAQVWNPPPRKVHPDTSRPYPQPNIPSSRAPEFIWNQVSCQIHKPRPPVHALAWQSPLASKRPRWPLDYGLSGLKCSRSFKESPGSINRIEQKGPWTVIASGSIGGLPDEPDEESNPYNRKGSLITYNVDGTLDIPTGHQVQKHRSIKHYAVHDVKFDPTRLSFVSTGADRKLRIWSPPDEDEAEADPNSMEDERITPSWTCFTLGTLHHIPHDLAFKPSSSILAVGEKKLHIYSLFENTYEHTRCYNHHSHKNHIVGSLVWGTRATSQHLFASSEPIDHGAIEEMHSVFEGIHSVYDIDHEAQIYKFDASEAGDTLSIASDGMTLALSTRGEQSHVLRLYDVARQHKSATATINLDCFPAHCEGEVTNTMFSPDGIYLSLARNDNHIHVYDVRYLGKGVIFDYAHSTESKAASQTLVYGVVKAQWIQSELTSRIALVTAGEDGCVRFWDPMKAAPDPKREDTSGLAQNGKVVAEVNSDIGHFSLGDRMEGEHRLVVGDCTGEVSFFSDVII